MSKVLVVYSGGLDSTALLYKCISEFDEVEAINFDYNSKHNASERKAAQKICDLEGIKLTEVNMPFINELFKSDLLQSGGDIPEGHYAEDNMKSTVVPFRNGIMLSIASGYAESIDADTIAIANHFGDRAVYPDCRQEFVQPMIGAILEGTGGKVRLISPFVGLTKAQIVEVGCSHGAPLELSWSCYNGGDRPCLKCSTCAERTEAFLLNNLQDPSLSSEEWEKAINIWKKYS